jgi:hypothetical protein
VVPIAEVIEDELSGLPSRLALTSLQNKIADISWLMPPKEGESARQIPILY